MEAVRSGSRSRSRKDLFRRIDDVALIGRIEQRDAEAFTQLVIRHGPSALALARRILHDRGTAEDVTRSSFLRVWQLAARYTPDRGSVGAWLMTIVRQASVDMVRSQGVPATTGDELEEVASRSLAARLDAPSDRRRARAAIMALPAFQRRIIEMMYLDACSAQQVAETLGLPLQTVNRWCVRGMQTLREQLTVAAG